jgi:hypothetical protein
LSKSGDGQQRKADKPTSQRSGCVSVHVGSCRRIAMH